MALHPLFDLDLLRTLVFIAEEASFTKAADRVGRTQSAVTLQVQKLEAQVQQSLLVRSKGGRVELTPQGRSLVESARAMLKLNDEAFRSLTASDLPTSLRLASSAMYVPFFLARAISRMRSLYPDVLIEVTEGTSCQLAGQMKDDAFDLIICEGAHAPRGLQSTEIWRGPLRWITAEAHDTHLQDPVPLCLAPSGCPWLPPWMDDCFWRSAPLRALEQAGRKYRVVASASSMAGLYGPVQTGDALTVSSGARLPDGLRVVRDDEGLPLLPDTAVVIAASRNAVQPQTDALIETIRSTFSLG